MSTRRKWGRLKTEKSGNDAEHLVASNDLGKKGLKISSLSGRRFETAERICVSQRK